MDEPGLKINKGFFGLAKKLSKHSTHRVQVGAVIAKNSRVLGLGFNKVKTHPKYTRHKRVASIHAEISALINSATDVRGSRIYVYRETKDGKPSLARPCSICEMALREAGVKEVYYSTGEYPYFKKEKLK